MLNNDYKILSKAIALRIKATLDDIIHEDQSGFLQGRFIGDNIISLTSIINHVNTTKQAALLISFDFEKAFDNGVDSSMECT